MRCNNTKLSPFRDMPWQGKAKQPLQIGYTYDSYSSCPGQG